MRTYNPMPPINILNERFTYSLVEGIIFYKIDWRKNRRGDIAGYYHRSSNRWYVKIDGATYPRNRLMYYMITGIDPGEYVIDHFDRVSTNDAWLNLRRVTNSVNSTNRAFPSSKYGKYIYHTPVSGRDYYQVRVRRKGYTHSKSFKTVAEAQRYIQEQGIY